MCRLCLRKKVFKKLFGTLLRVCCDSKGLPCTLRQVGWLCWPRLTVSLYFAKLNVMLTQSDFIFSKFFSREYSLLAVAPMGSSLEGKAGTAA